MEELIEEETNANVVFESSNISFCSLGVTLRSRAYKKNGKIAIVIKFLVPTP
jgi:hypothetical protein